MQSETEQEWKNMHRLSSDPHRVSTTPSRRSTIMSQENGVTKLSKKRLHMESNRNGARQETKMSSRLHFLFCTVDIGENQDQAEYHDSLASKFELVYVLSRVF